MSILDPAYGDDMTEPLRTTCVWCGDPLTAGDGVWTNPLSGDYCPEGLAVGVTGTSPHLPALAADPARPGLDAERLAEAMWNVRLTKKRFYTTDARAEAIAAEYARLTEARP